MHYSWDTEERARRAFRNVSAILQPGGCFIGTMPDADVLVRKLRDGWCLTLEIFGFGSLNVFIWYIDLLVLVHEWRLMIMDAWAQFSAELSLNGYWYYVRILNWLHSVRFLNVITKWAGHICLIELLICETAPELEFGNRVYRVRFDEKYSEKVCCVIKPWYITQPVVLTCTIIHSNSTFNLLIKLSVGNISNAYSRIMTNYASQIPEIYSPLCSNSHHQHLMEFSTSFI